MRLADLRVFNAEVAARRAVALVTNLQTNAQRVVTRETLARDPLRELLETRFQLGTSGVVASGEGDVFIAVKVPPVRLLAIGAVHISQALAVMARLVDMDVTVVDPRTAFATPERFPETPVLAEWPDDVLPAYGLDSFTAVCLLTHDPRIDDQALVAALRADCFYIGALGSRKTHAKRLERMREKGFGAEALDRIHAPIGLDIGAVAPSEIAVSIVAEIIAARGRKPARAASGPGA